MLAACVQDSPLPDVGPCAVYPDGVYEYGQIGIGTCLAGPTDLQFLSDGRLAITNGNPWLDFTGGSLLVVDTAALEDAAAAGGRTLVSDLGAAALDLPTLSGPMGYVPDQDMLLVAGRFSEGGRTRSIKDQVWLVDVAGAPALAGAGVDGADAVQVGADPNAVAVDAAGEMAWVVNRTQHSVSMLDLGDPASGEPVKLIPPGGAADVEPGDFVDVDGDGSTAGFARLTTLESTDPDTHDYAMRWSVGQVRAWLPVADGLRRWTGNGELLAPAWEVSNVEAEVDVAATGGAIAEALEPSFMLDSSALGRMFFEEAGQLRQAVAPSYLADWDFVLEPTLTGGGDGAWDAAVSGPSAIIADGLWYLFYDGTAAGGDNSARAVGLALSADGENFARASDQPVLELPGTAVSDPHVIYDGATARWRMWVTLDDGSGRRSIGHSESEDLLSWSPVEAVFAPEIDASRPVVGWYNGLFHLFYTAPTATGWEVREAIGIDGYAWEERGSALPLEQEAGAAMQFAAEGSFRLTTEAGDVLEEVLVPGEVLGSTVAGWTAQVATGYTVGPEAGGDLTSGGVSLDAALDGLYWFSAVDFSGKARIVVGQEGPDGRPVPGAGVVGPAAGFRADGAYSATVVAGADGGYVMLFAGRSGSVSSIGRAVSSDGLAWTVDDSAVLTSAASWDSVELAPGSVERQADGSLRLWYTGFDGAQYRVGLAGSTDEGRTWTRIKGPRYDWVFDGGVPGEWHDSGVRDPWVITEDGRQKMWFAGFDGDLWQIGYAERGSDAEEWTISEDALGTPRPVITAVTGSFGAEGLLRPVATPEADGYHLWISGVDGGSARSGEAVGREPDRLHRILHQPGGSDTLSFRSVPAREEDALLLDVVLDIGELLALGCADAVLDEPRGFLYVPCRQVPEVLVIDIRDDSIGTFRDTNYLDLEAIIVVETTSTAGTAGWRAAMVDEARGWLWGLAESPESVQAIPLDAVVDDAAFDLIRRPFAAMLPLPRAGDRDQGVPTQAWVGPGQMALHPDGRHLFVTNFNDNSVSVYDLSLGPVGTLVGEIPEIGENPYSIAISPDGRRAAVAMFSGEVEDASTHSTLVWIDVDETSAGWLQPLTWVVNK